MVTGLIELTGGLTERRPGTEQSRQEVTLISRVVESGLDSTFMGFQGLERVSPSRIVNRNVSMSNTVIGRVFPHFSRLFHHSI